MSFRQRLLNGLLAGFFGQMVSVAIQLVSLPVFLHYWGSQRYGEWLLLSAIPAYLALSDIGFSSVASNQMTMDVAAGRRAEALRSLHSTLGIILLASGAVIAASISLSFLPVERYLHLAITPHREVGITLVLMSLQVALGFLSGLISAGYRCEGGYARATVAINLLRFAEFLASVVVLACGSGVVALAGIVTAVRLLGTLWMRLDLRQRAAWITFNLKSASLATVRSLTSPALAFATWPLAVALQQQGLVLMIGAILGPPVVVIWTACRTVARALFQASGVLNGALWPELSRTVGEGDLALSCRLHRLAVGVSLWGMGLLSVLLFCARDLIFRIWSHGSLAISAPLFALTLCQTIINLLWGTSSVVAASVNRHQRNTLAYVSLVALGLVVAFPLIRQFGLEGATASVLLVDLCMLPVATMSAVGIAGDRLGPFLVSIATPPWRPIVHTLKRLRSEA
jgi:O-antigen/teichoic acid export membrane protein